MSQHQKHRPLPTGDAGSLEMQDLKAPTVGKEFINKTEAMLNYLKKKGGRICVCGDPACGIGPFRELSA